MDAQKLKDFFALDPGHYITGPSETGTLEQQIEFAVESYSWNCKLEYGYTMDDEVSRAEVRALIEKRLRARGVIE